MTGLAAFTVTFILSLFLGWAQVTGVILVLVLVILAFYRTHLTHKNRAKRNLAQPEDLEEIPSVQSMFEANNRGITKTLNTVSSIFTNTIKGLVKEDHKELKKQLQLSVELEQRLVNKKKKIHQTISSLPADSIEASHYYVLALDYQKEFAHCIYYLSEPVYTHVDNNHKPILPAQAVELKAIAQEFEGFAKMMIETLDCNSCHKLEEINAEQVRIIGMIREARKNLIKAIKKNDVGTRNSMLLLSILSEARNILIYSVNMMKIQNDFTSLMKN